MATVEIAAATTALPEKILVEEVNVEQPVETAPEKEPATPVEEAVSQESKETTTEVAAVEVPIASEVEAELPAEVETKEVVAEEEVSAPTEEAAVEKKEEIPVDTPAPDLKEEVETVPESGESPSIPATETVVKEEEPSPAEAGEEK